MRILVVMDPISRIDIERDTTFGFLLAAQARGHAIHYCGIRDLFIGADGAAGARAAAVSVRAVAGNHFALGEAGDHPLADFDTVWMRKDPPVDRDYLHATHLLAHAERETLVVNRPGALATSNEKLYALKFREYTPPTLVTRDVARARAWLSTATAPLVAKPVDGHGGFGVFVLEPGDRNAPSILETLTHGGRRWIIVQPYLPAARAGDKRIILLDGEPRGAILRVPQDHDHRGNIHVGGRVVATELTPREAEICAAMGPRLRADGLTFVGIDVIGDFLTEVNVTSPTGIREIAALGGADIADEYVRWCEGRVAR